MSAAEKLYTPAEYLAMDAASFERLEYLDGLVYAMAGATPSHEALITNLLRELSISLRDRPCRTFSSSLRVKVEAAGIYTYPDISVVCGPERYEETRPPTLLNPLVLVEVLSDSTESYDRGRKFQLYRRIDSLRAYVLVAQDRVSVEVFHRTGARESWKLSEYDTPGQQVALPSLAVEIPLDEIYHKVTLPELVDDAQLL